MPLHPTVLYEDSHSANPKYFGPHELLCACVADRTSRSLHDVRRALLHNPRRGVGELRKTASTVAHHFAAAPHLLMVLVDSDRIREHLDLPHDACRTQVVSKLQGLHGFVVVLLQDNTESLLRVVASVLGEPAHDRKPTPADRDRLLVRAAHTTTAEQREEILVRLPSFRRLVTAAVKALEQP